MISSNIPRVCVLFLLVAGALGFSPARDRRTYEFVLHPTAFEHREKFFEAIKAGLRERGGVEEKSDIAHSRRFTFGWFTAHVWESFAGMRVEFTGPSKKGCSEIKMSFLDAEILEIVSSLTEEIRDGLTVTNDRGVVLFEEKPSQLF